MVIPPMHATNGQTQQRNKQWSQRFAIISNKDDTLHHTCTLCTHHTVYSHCTVYSADQSNAATHAESFLLFYISWFIRVEMIFSNVWLSGDFSATGRSGGTYIGVWRNSPASSRHPLCFWLCLFLFVFFFVSFSFCHCVFDCVFFFLSFFEEIWFQWDSPAWFLIFFVCVFSIFLFVCLYFSFCLFLFVLFSLSCCLFVFGKKEEVIGQPSPASSLPPARLSQMGESGLRPSRFKRASLNISRLPTFPTVGDALYSRQPILQLGHMSHLRFPESSAIKRRDTLLRGSFNRNPLKEVSSPPSSFKLFWLVPAWKVWEKWWKVWHLNLVLSSSQWKK